MSEPRQLPSRIAVIGGGQVALITAIALRQALPTSNIVLVPSEVAACDLADQAITALPFTNRLHDKLGISEADMIRFAGASHRLVVRYGDWAGPGSGAAAAYGQAQPAALQGAFIRHWGATDERTANVGTARTAAEMLDQQGRFVPPLDNSHGSGATAHDEVLAEVDYALRWTGEGYRRLLSHHARALGVVLRSGVIASVATDGPDLAAISFTDGSTLDADLFIDCSGSAAQLLRHLGRCRRVDWRTRLPIRRMAMARGNRPQLRLHDRIGLTRAGWVADVGTTGGQLAVLGMLPNASDEAAYSLFGTRAIDFVPIDQGRVEDAWIGNVIAIGDAAVCIEPLGWTPLDIAHRMVDLLLDLLPGLPIEQRERDEFNRRYRLIAEGACDFVASHYAAPAAERFYGAPDLSDACRTMLDQFRRRGRIPYREDMPLAREEWFGTLAALGIMPGLPAVDASTAESDGDARLARHRARLDAAVAQVPAYAEWYCSFMVAA